MANEVATKTTKKETVSSILQKQSVKVLSANLMLTEAQQTKARCSALKLASDGVLSKCDPFSIVKYCFETARYDFGRDDCIYPVPYGNKIQAQVGYRGFRELAMRTGKYKDINASIVKACDHIERDPYTGVIKVEFCKDVEMADNSLTIGYFAYALDLKGNIVSSVYWTKKHCEEHGRKYSKAYNSIWGNEFTFDKMALKTVIKQLCSMLDSSTQMQNLQKTDQIVFGGENEQDSYKDNPNNDKETNEVANSLGEIDFTEFEDVGENDDQQQ